MLDRSRACARWRVAVPIFLARVVVATLAKKIGTATRQRAQARDLSCLNFAQYYAYPGQKNWDNRAHVAQARDHDLYMSSMHAPMFGLRHTQLRACLNFFGQYYPDQKKRPLRLCINPLWGHCQEYKIEKKAILQERPLSEKRSAFADYNLTLSEIFCLTDHEKPVQKFVAHWKVCQKSSQKEVIREECVQSAKIAKSVASCVASQVLQVTDKLPSFPQAGRVLSDRKIDLQTTLSSRSQLESSAGKPFTSSSANQTPRQELRTTPLQGARMEGSATSEGQNDNFFYRTKVFSKRQHAYDRLSFSCMHAKN